jgi:pimeloyl-ACP methyl ester carboxylesterase
MSHTPQKHVTDKYKAAALTTINNKPVFYRNLGIEENSHQSVVFVHGLGGSNDYFMPLVRTLGLQNSYSLHLYDFEGHGLSPASLLSKISIGSLAEDLNGVFEHASITSGATVVAHSMGCLIAVQFILAHPGKVSRLILLGPPPSPLSENDSQNLTATANSARVNGMSAVADSEVLRSTRTTNQLAITAAKLSLLGQDPNCYAKACMALADAKQLDFGAIQAQTLLVTGSKDMISPPELCERYQDAMQGRASVRVLNDVGHWHAFEDCSGVAKVVGEFLSQV